MAPKNKFTKEEMVAAALRVVRAKGADGLTAKTIADELGTSTQPIFTAFRFSASARSTSASRGRSPSSTGFCF